MWCIADVASCPIFSPFVTMGLRAAICFELFTMLKQVWYTDYYCAGINIAVLCFWILFVNHWALKAYGYGNLNFEYYFLNNERIFFHQPEMAPLSLFGTGMWLCSYEMHNSINNLINLTKRLLRHYLWTLQSNYFSTLQQ